MFLAPAFLAGLLAIALPLWLHRVARANPTRHPFASAMLLEASETQRTAKRTLRYWLLLAARIALLIALALAFAGPLVSPRAVPVLNPDARLHAVVLDTSLSMQYGKHWQQAIEQAEKILDAARPGDQFMLATAGGRRIQVVQSAVNASEVASVRAALPTLRPGTERLDYGLLMTTARSWLGTPRLPVELHLVSDLQQSASPLRFADLRPPADTRLVFHDVAEEGAANTYIKNAAVAASDTRTLTVDVQTTSPRVEAREAIVLVDGSELARKRFEVGPAIAARQPVEGEGGRSPNLLSRGVAVPGFGISVVNGGGPRAHTSVHFASLNFAAGTHRIEVRLEPQDALPQDDRFHAVVEHADPKVLLVSRTKQADDAVYAGAAITSLSAPRLAVDQRAAQEIEGRGLQGYSAIVITDVAALSSATATRIADYVRTGGALLVTLRPGAAEQGGGLLNGLRVRDVDNRPTRVGHIEASHPALRDSTGWQDIRFFRHLQVESAPNDTILIALQDGAPLLIERNMGAGRMLVLTTPLDRDWNDLATHPLFVRFIAEAARYLTGADASAATARVGSVVMTGLTAAAGGQIFDPQGRRVLNLNETASAQRLIPQLPGFYEIRGAEGVRWLAVNTDARESDLGRLPRASLQRWQGLRKQADRSAREAAGQPPPDTARQTSIGYWLLMLAVILVLVEIFMANHYLAVRREVPR